MTVKYIYSRVVGMRLTGRNKLYYRNQIELFATLRAKYDDDVAAVEFGKQDQRGGYSIALVDNQNRHFGNTYFESKQELLGYVVGWTESHYFHEVAGRVK